MKFNSANTNCQYNYIALKTISISRWSVPLDIYPLQLPFMTIPYNSHGKFTHYYHSHVRIPSKSVRIATGSHLWSFQLWSPRTRTRCASKRRIKRNRIWWYLSQWNLNSISCNLFFVASQFLNSVGLQLFFDIFFPVSTDSFARYWWSWWYAFGDVGGRLMMFRYFCWN